MTVFENVAFPLVEHTRLPRRQIAGKVRAMLETVDLAEAAGRFPAELSGGMKKRAALARSVILDSRILLCDEPTSGLDPVRSRQISDLIRDCARRLGCTTVITSHDVVNSLRIADRLALISDGRIQVEGTADEMRSSGHPLVKAFLE